MHSIPPTPPRADTLHRTVDGSGGQSHTSRDHRGDDSRASSLTAHGPGHDDHHSDATSHGAGRADLDRLMPIFQRLVEETVSQVLACPAKPDPAFEGFEELLAPIRSATTLEGNLLERGIEAICQCNDNLVVVQLEGPLPVLPEARAFLRRNDWSKALALRLGGEVHTREFYRPDLLLVDARNHRALILDIKRSITSHKPKVLLELRTRMMAAALVARDWLERECDAPAVERVEIAIIDGSGEPPDHSRAIFTLGDLDLLLGIDGAGEAIALLRRLYGERIRDVLLERCRKVVGAAASAEAQQSIDDPERGRVTSFATEHRHDGPADQPRKAGHEAFGCAAVFHRDRRVSVGIASLGDRA